MGSRLTDLAAQATTTKQSAGFLVDQLERTGYVDRVADPVDRRARLVRIAVRGTRCAEVSRTIVDRVAAEWTAHLGEHRMAQLRSTLTDLRGITDPGPEALGAHRRSKHVLPAVRADGAAHRPAGVLQAGGPARRRPRGPAPGRVASGWSSGAGCASSADGRRPGGGRVDDADRGPAERYRAALPGERHELEIDGYDRAGVPSVSAEWSSAGSPGPGPVAQTGVGYGDTPGAAATGAWGELTEELLLARHVARVAPVTGSYDELSRARGADRVADPVSLVLPAGCDDSPHRPLLWLPAVRWRTGEEVLVPAEFVAASPGTLPYAPPSGQWLTTPITNGLGAGDTLERAVLHGLLELVQRDGNTVSHRALDTGVVLDLADADDPALHALVGDLAARGIEVDLKLASTEFATVVHAVGTDRAAVAGEAPVVPVALSALGEAAHPDPAQAARKAVLEYAASRARRAFAFGPLEEVRRRDPAYLERELARPLPAQEERALAAMTAWVGMTAAELTAVLAPMTARTTTVPFGSLPTPAPDRRAAWADPAVLLAEVLDRLATFDVLVVAEQAEGPLGPVSAAKVIAPGLEVETLSYLRVGERVVRRLLERDSPLVGLGPAAGGRLPVRLTPDAGERLGGPAWLDAEEVDRVVGPLYPLYREPSRHAVERIRLGR